MVIFAYYPTGIRPPTAGEFNRRFNILPCLTRVLLVSPPGFTAGSSDSRDCRRGEWRAAVRYGRRHSAAQAGEVAGARLRVLVRREPYDLLNVTISKKPYRTIVLVRVFLMVVVVTTS